MQFDSVGSEPSSPTDIRDFAEDDLTREARDRGHGDAPAGGLAASSTHGPEDDVDVDVDDDDVEEDDEDEPLAAPRVTREGLPARFRMRHTPHYVDELLGGAPLRTVREIPTAEIESPIDDRAELDELERSIQRFGVLEPLLVDRRGASYRVIAGMRRLRAALRVGLDTVPCLVHEHQLDDDRFEDIRGAAAQRVSVPSPPEPEPQADVFELDADESGEVFTSPAAPTPAIGEAALGLDFVTTLLPAMSAAGNDRLRWGVLADLAAVELSRTKQAAAARQVLQDETPLQRASIDPRSLLADVVQATATEARLRGVRVDSAPPDDIRDIFVDPSQCGVALTGLVQGLMALAPRAGALLRLHAHIPAIRPALIVECAIDASDSDLGAEAMLRFFDAEWLDHPCGRHGAEMLAAVAHTARRHGGRVEAKLAGQGCLVRFIVPRLDG